MRKYTLESIKLKHQIEHSLDYQSHPRLILHTDFYTEIKTGQTVIISDSFRDDAILKRIVHGNLEFLLNLPLSSSIKTEVMLH